jgi:hypothetical protein
LRDQEIRKVCSAFHALGCGAQTAHESVRLHHAVEHGIGFRHVGSYGSRSVVDIRFPGSRNIRVYGWHQCHQPAVDRVEVLENHVDLSALDSIGTFA